MARLTIKLNDEIYDIKNFNGNLSIGRDGDNDIVLNGNDVSRYHAIIYPCASKGYLLQDLSSKNHIKVGDKYIQSYKLNQGATFQICDFKFYFDEINDESEFQDVKFARKKTSHKKVGLEPQQTVYSPGNVLKSETFSSASLLQLVVLSNEIMATLDHEAVIEKSLEMLMKMFRAKRGFIALKDERNVLKYSILKGFDQEGSSIRVSKTMIDQVVDQGFSVLTGNAVTEREYKGNISVCEYNLKSVVCVPLITLAGSIGCIYMDHSDQIDVFSESDLTLISFIARQIAIAIDNSRMHKKVMTQLTSLENTMILKDQIIVKSTPMKELYYLVEKAGKTKAAVFILGESGVGKELVAKAIHTKSDRRGQFIALNCAALPEHLIESELFGYEKGAFTGAEKAKPGLFELADNGTLFLDEIGDMPVSLQAKLLRVLQDNKALRLGGSRHINFDVRIVSATNKDIKNLVLDGTFRNDLFYRLNQMPLLIPPLRERKADILPLARYLLMKFCGENELTVPSFSNKVAHLLLEYNWPGNINELKNAMIRSAIICDSNMLKSEHLPQEIQKIDSNLELDFLPIEELEKQHILKALQITKGNKKRAAEILGIARDTIHKKIEKYAIDAE
jgi:transcriptional regulator with GAF, ATPase, and Fis domain